MGEFEIDDLGNFIILRGERGELLDKKERRVNRRGYLIDRFGNVINKNNQIIFKAVELDSDDEIPAPFGFEKRKKNLLNLGEDGVFKVNATEKQIMDDEDLIDRELKKMRKSGKKKKAPKGANGSGPDMPPQVVEEGEDESSVDSLMAESPTKYAKDITGAGASAGEDGKASRGKLIGPDISGIMDENDLIDKVTQKKVPKKKPPQGVNNKGAEKKSKQAPPQMKRKFSPKNVNKGSQPGPANDKTLENNSRP
jgi:hypothetical protein